MHIEVDAEVAVRVEGPAALCAEEAGWFLGVLRALVLQQLGRSGKRCGAVHTGMKRQHASFRLLLSVSLSVRVVADLSTGRKGGKRARELWGMRAG